MSRMSGFVASTTWDPGSISDGAEAATTVTVPGAKLGDFALASLEEDVSDLVLDANVTGANTVSVVLANNTGGSVDLDSSTLRVKVVPKDVI